MYSTNGSIFPNKETLEIWAKFKTVAMTFSIDAVGDRFHYIRWPLLWDKVKNNIEQICNLDQVSEVRIYSVVNPMNILYTDELDLWFDDLKKTYAKVISITYAACHGKWGLDATPDFLRDRVIKKYNNDHPVIKLLSSRPINLQKWPILLNDLNNLDLRRKLSSRTTFPEVFL
jgi:MoaA/NifB/PqqE/SkfB family radical SAM enzyme